MAGEDKGKIKLALILQFFDTMLSFVPVGAALLFYQSYIDNTLTSTSWLQLFLVLAVGIIVRSFVRYYIDSSQYTTIYKMFYGERIKVADYLKKVPMGFFSDDNIGKVTTTLTTGITFIEEQCINSIIIITTGIINMIFIVVTLAFINIPIALIFVLTIVVITLVFIPYQRTYVKISMQHNEANENLTSAVIEYVKNISAIKSFNLIGKHKRSDEAFENRRTIDIKSEMINIPYLISGLCIVSVATAAIVYLAVKSINSTSVYTVILLVIIALYIFKALETILFKLAIISISKDALDKIDELYAEEEIKIKADKRPNGYNIEFKDVEFSYGENKVIDNISFTLKENTMNALVGLSGSGKSTLVNLIPRFYDIQKGNILIGGVDVRDMSQETLYSSISMVFQNVYLFKDTIYNNIAFGNDNATKEQIIDACKKARCYDFIMALPEGLDTMVGEAGLSLSGGERQRISIARAILKNAPIVLLDEATASVDPDNEYEIQEAINELVKDKTILVIAHKLACVKNADNILVIKDGKLIEQGTHNELAGTDGLYSALWQKRSQSKSWKIGVVQ